MAVSPDGRPKRPGALSFAAAGRPNPTRLVTEKSQPIYPGAKMTEAEYEKSVAKRMEVGRRLTEVPEFPVCEACGGPQYKLNGELQCGACITKRVQEDRLLGRGEFAPKPPKGEKKKRGKRVST